MPRGLVPAIHSVPVNLEWLVQLVANLLNLNAGELWQGGKKSLTVERRGLVCFWATQELGMTAISVGSRLKLSQPTPVEQHNEVSSGRRKRDGP
jgi:hypothetical protein